MVGDEDGGAAQIGRNEMMAATPAHGLAGRRPEMVLLAVQGHCLQPAPDKQPPRIRSWRPVPRLPNWHRPNAAAA